MINLVFRDRLFKMDISVFPATFLNLETFPSNLYLKTVVLKLQFLLGSFVSQIDWEDFFYEC